ncbi:DUF4412 domain-containing protein [Marinirhabdus gelatinilytica]|uniref:Uncharacterized protein DUF4412 n=1 Tax=Marinirhabdus gelatinilytica TaxID=1703343 RepID=A0A370QF15_9FLAO|nr:DUF4412 domain-containing protein [Marinirhabdus gelatinilytica]RDK86965.1 uncharacterized protein DUF4412 [Marinirhabdus gelatinilytica]
MKFLKTLCTILFISSVSVNANAQFFKKLKKKAENAVERTVLNKTDREVSKETDKTIDGVIKGDKKKEKEEPTDEEKEAAEKNAMNIFGGSLEGIPDSYEFQYIMDMKLTTHKDKMDMRYFIQPDASYFGNAIVDKRANSIIVYDMENQAMITFMDNGSQKMAMKTRMPFDEAAQKEMAKNDTNQEDVNITPLPSKTILGYHCKGYQIEQEDGVSKFYITNEAPVSFVGVFSSIQQMPKSGYNATVPFDENSMVMEMEFISNNRKRDNVHIICTNLAEKKFAINKADY